VYDLKYPWLSTGYPADAVFYGWKDQWSRLYEAMDLNLEAALTSASYGLFQVMGFNHNGWTAVGPFVNAMFVSEYEHLKAFISFCKDNHLSQYIVTQDWPTFASKYNGAAYATHNYATKMAGAYARYAKSPH
jgi:hypothetical protein